MMFFIGCHCLSRRKEKTMNEWISVKDKLPKTEDYVLVWFHGRICTGYYHKRFGWKIPKDFVPDDEEVKYWRPYLELPKGES